MTSPRTASLALTLFITFHAQAQLDRTHIQGAASPYALSSDYRALGYNPALLTHSGWAGVYQRVTGGFEGGLSVKSNLLDRTSMWDQVLGREVEESSDWTKDDWLNALVHHIVSFCSLRETIWKMGDCLCQPSWCSRQHHIELKDSEVDD